jgi:Zn-finger nucleic acid-binding protein
MTNAAACGMVRGMNPGNELPTQMECPQCNAPMKSFWVQSRNPGIDVELDRCHSCGGVWFDAGELEVATGRSVLKSKTASDRFCPRCLIPLLNAELTAGVAVEACRSCKGTYLDARDMDTVTKQKSVKPPEDVTFVCEACGQRKPFAQAQTTALGTECNDCFSRNKRAPATAADKERASTFSSFVGWLRGD